MCASAVEGIHLQCGREYGFSDPDENQCAAVLSAISVTELEGFPTNNLATERNLSLFDRCASKVAKCRNYKFTAKSIRNDMLLHKEIQDTVDRITHKVTALLNAREKKWDVYSKSKN